LPLGESRKTLDARFRPAGMTAKQKGHVKEKESGLQSWIYDFPSRVRIELGFRGVVDKL